MNKTRRKLVGAFATGAVVVPLGGLIALRAAQAADTPKLSPDDPLAKSLMYTHQSADADKLCSGCQLYTPGADAEWGACVIFAQKRVSGRGFCTSWIKRAG